MWRRGESGCVGMEFAGDGTRLVGHTAKCARSAEPRASSAIRRTPKQSPAPGQSPPWSGWRVATSGSQRRPTNGMQTRGCSIPQAESLIWRPRSKARQARRLLHQDHRSHPRSRVPVVARVPRPHLCRRRRSHRLYAADVRLCPDRRRLRARLVLRSRIRRQWQGPLRRGDLRHHGELRHNRADGGVHRFRGRIGIRQNSLGSWALAL